MMVSVYKKHFQVSCIVTTTNMHDSSKKKLLVVVMKALVARLVSMHFHTNHFLVFNWV